MSDTASVAATPVATEGSTTAPVEVAGGGANIPVNFDQMETLTSRFKEEVAPKAEPEAEATEEAAEQEAKAEEKPVEEEKTKAELKAEAKRIAKIKLKMGDKNLEITSDAMIPVKVDGKTIEVPVADVLSSYSSKSQRDREFHQFNNDKKSFETQRQKLSDVVNKSYEMLSQKQDLRGFVEYMSEALGVDGQKLYSDAVEKIRQAVEQDSALSPEERQLKQLQEENQFYRSKAEAQRTAEAQAKELKTLETQVSELMTQSGMDKATFVKAYDDLISTGVEAKAVTPAMVQKFYSNQRTIETIETRLKDINPEAADEKTIERLATLAIQTDANPAEIQEIIDSLYGNVAEKKLSKKVSKTLTKKQSEAGNRNAATAPSFFDDLTF